MAKRKNDPTIKGRGECKLCKGKGEIISPFQEGRYDPLMQLSETCPQCGGSKKGLFAFEVGLVLILITIVIILL